MYLYYRYLSQLKIPLHGEEYTIKLFKIKSLTCRMSVNFSGYSVCFVPISTWSGLSFLAKTINVDQSFLGGGYGIERGLPIQTHLQLPVWDYVRTHIFSRPISDESTFLNREHFKSCYPIGQYSYYLVWLDSKTITELNGLLVHELPVYEHFFRLSIS